jgi:hypothetical protein
MLPFKSSVLWGGSRVGSRVLAENLGAGLEWIMTPNMKNKNRKKSGLEGIFGIVRCFMHMRRFVAEEQEQE